MSIKRLLSTDPLTETSTWHHFDEVTEESVIETVQDVSNVLEFNKSQFNDTDERARWSKDMTKVASIPMNIYYELKKQGILGDQKKLKAWLNDSENRFFRTRPGRV